MTAIKKDEIKIKIFPLIGTADRIYPELLKIRKNEKVLEEFINLTPFEQQAPKLQGLHSIAPQMALMMSCLIICENNDL